MKKKGKGKDLIIVVLILAAPFLFLTGVRYGYGFISCKLKAESFENKYHLIAGCMVKHNDKWIPLESLRGYGD